MRRRYPALFATVLVLGACGHPGGEGVAQLQAAIALDASLFQYVKRFRIDAIEVGSSGDQTITCSDFPSRFTLASPDLQSRIGKRRLELEWGGQQQEIEVAQTMRVPADTPLLFVVEGLAPYQPPGQSQSTFVVARGCTAEAGFEAGQPASVAIDAVATVGTPCSSAGDCEKPQLSQCMSGLGFGNGYCTLPSCTTGSCPPDSACVGDASGTFCARRCPAVNDTNNCPIDIICQARTGADGCSLVCVPVDWNTAATCTP